MNEINSPLAEHEAAVKTTVKYDWYQSETHVFINLLVKGLKENDIKIQISDKQVAIYFADQLKISDIVIELSELISKDDFGFKLLPSKVEIKLKKGSGVRWKSLVKSQVPSSIPEYPTSAPKKYNWNKIEADVKEEEKHEKLEGDAALAQLFQNIYGEGSDEVKKAMNKSFMESGGTVLSTNWSEVSKERTAMKPPDGMEFKKWDM